MIHINEDHLTREINYGHLNGDFQVVALEGREEFEILCPVSVVTGHRTSLQEAILHLTNDNVEIANNLIENLDPSYSDEKLSVKERLDLVKDRLSSGSFAENDGYMKALQEFIQLNYPQQVDSVQELVESTSKQVEPVVEPNKE